MFLLLQLKNHNTETEEQGWAQLHDFKITTTQEDTWTENSHFVQTCACTL